jgi:hypothetical protein
MRWCRKDNQSTAEPTCFPLLRALLGKQRRVRVELISGMSFIDEVVGMEGADAAAVAVFSSQRRVAVSDIDVIAVAELA